MEDGLLYCSKDSSGQQELLLLIVRLPGTVSFTLSNPAVVLIVAHATCMFTFRHSAHTSHTRDANTRMEAVHTNLLCDCCTMAATKELEAGCDMIQTTWCGSGSSKAEQTKKIKELQYIIAGSSTKGFRPMPMETRCCQKNFEFQRYHKISVPVAMST